MDTIQPPHYCIDMKQALESEDAILRYNDAYREYGIVIHDGGSSHLTIGFCPFCGAELPPSFRDEWFAVLERRGESSEHVPQDMRDGSWWRHTDKYGNT